MTRHLFRSILMLSAAAAMLSAQGMGVAPSVPFVPPPPKPEQTPATPPATPPGTAPATTQTTTPPAAGGPVPGRMSATDPFSMDNVSLTEMIQVLARQLKINYILDPRIKGAVTIHTYGASEGKPVDLMSMLQTILRVNQAAIVQVGDLYRIVPIAAVSNSTHGPRHQRRPQDAPGRRAHGA